MTRLTPGETAPAQKSGVHANRLIEALKKGQPAISADTWTFVDCEHNPFNLSVLRQTILKLLTEKNSAGQPTVAPVVRIPAEGDELAANRWMIKQALESGAMGIMVPKVETADDALRMVQAIRFPQLRGSEYPDPAGLRGSGYSPPDWGLENPADYPSFADVWPMNPEGELVALPMIESLKGRDNVEAILDVQGVTGVFVGLVDFARSHGVLDHEDPEVQASVKKIADACVSKNKYCGITATAGTQERYLGWGFEIIIRSDMPNSATPPI